MNNLLRKLALGTLLLAFLAGSAFAQGRIATIDLNKTFTSYWKRKQAEATLKDQQADIEKELKSLQDEYKKINETYQKLLDSASDPAISAEERSNRKSQADEKLKLLKQKQDDYTGYKNRAELDLSERRKNVISRIISEIRNVVAARAKSANYALVVDSGNESAIVYASSDNDITKEIIDDLNANDPSKNAAADDATTGKKSEKKK